MQYEDNDNIIFFQLYTYLLTSTLIGMPYAKIMCPVLLYHSGKDRVNELIQAIPELLEEINTGKARQIHKSEKNQHYTQTLVNAGAGYYDLDT